MALKHFEAGLAVYEGMPRLHFGLGVAAFMLGDIERAAAALQRCVEGDPKYPQVHYYLALVAESRGDQAKAVEEYRAEVENDPVHYESWFNLALMLSDSGNLEGASDALRQAIIANPDLAVAYLYLGQALLAQDDPAVYEEAEQAVELGLALEPTPELRQLGRNLLLKIDRARRQSRRP
jgi:tetratricopeptide (TPR) repeat protein